ncbi:hypothetical protein GT022_13125 [Agaribacter marinus]|uniref:Uncharacterized protein n=1 Tax=Virgibacillus salarius TaxID=447199 RepID=A0A941E149_9BACI|nr:hypothetical protein [Virgibacillus salarius]MBR7796988.1 hypothetical protein [Virgibacillus salarius]NAZ09698.1 hypothetical protein [Agaribacter marinus]
MDALSNLIDAIFSNFFIVFAIIAGIIGVLKDGSKKDDQKGNRQPNRTKPTPTPSGGTPNRNRTQSIPNSTNASTTVSTISVDDQHKEQMERLANQMGADKSSESLDITKYSKTLDRGQIQQIDDELTEVQKQLKKQVSNNLTRKGLVNGIIMAEVLGKPRAIKPYRNVIAERRRR